MTLLERLNEFGVRTTPRTPGDPVNLDELRRALAIAQAVEEWENNALRMLADPFVIDGLKERADELLRGGKDEQA